MIMKPLGLSAGIAATALGLALPGIAAADSAHGPAAPDCYNGVWPLNASVANCALPARQTHILGAAPDASALINCRGNMLCLSLYVNGGYGWYPGAVIAPGYRP